MTKLLLTLTALVAMAFASQGQPPKPFDAITGWSEPVAIRTNDAGRVSYGRIAKIPKANQDFWAAYRTNKAELRVEGYSVTLRKGGWHAVHYTDSRPGR